MKTRGGLILLAVLCVCAISVCAWADDDAIMDVDDLYITAHSGTWTQSSWAPCAVGGSYKYAWGPNQTVTFVTDQISDINGEFAVYARWTSHSNRNNNVTYKIYSGTSTPSPQATITGIDQRSHGCEWRYLATVSLSAGHKGKVVIDSGSGAFSNEATIADAVRFVRISKDKDDIKGYVNQSDRVDWQATNEIQCLPSNTDTIVETLSITLNTSGYVIVNATGTFDFPDISSGGWHQGRCSITKAPANTLDFNHVVEARPYRYGAGFIPFATTRGFEVSSGTHTFRLICDENEGSVCIRDPQMTAIFSKVRM